MPSELGHFPADSLGHGQRVPAARVSDFADDHDLFQLATATDPSLLVCDLEDSRKSITAYGRLAWIEEYDIVRHQSEQADEIASVDGINPG